MRGRSRFPISEANSFEITKSNNKNPLMKIRRLVDNAADTSACCEADGALVAKQLKALALSRQQIRRLDLAE